MPRYTDIALGAGAVLAVGLGLIALQPDQLPSGGAEGGAVRTNASESPTASASPTETRTRASDERPTAWLVGAGDDLVIRAARTDCTAAAPASLTTVDAGGGTVTRQVEGLAAVGGIEVTDDRTAQVVGVDAECERVGFGTTDAGRTWVALDEVPSIWSVLPGDSDRIQAPSGLVDVPCEPLTLTGLDAQVARLACADGRILGTVSGGEEWSILGNNGDVLAVGFVSATTALALVERDDCDGVSVDRSADAGTDFEEAYCVEGSGPWGLVARGETVAVTGDDTLARSSDAGETWDVVRMRS